MVYVNDFYSFEKEFIEEKGNILEMVNMMAFLYRNDQISIEHVFIN